MGYISHNAIIVTSWDKELIVAAHAKAKELLQVSEILESGVNGYRSFFIPPDGSKEGWDESDAGETNREAFVEWLDAQRYEDGSTALDWVEVRYSPDDRESEIVRDGWNR